MIELSFSSTKEKLLQAWLKFWLQAVPNSTAGQVRYQVLAIFLLAVIQVTILPGFLPEGIFIDLLTPWLALSLVLHSHFRAYSLTLFAGIVLETHLSVPIGFILSPYFCFSVLILNIRNHISWRRVSSWFTLFILFQIWLFSFKLLFDMMHYEKQTILNLTKLLQFLVNITSSALFGLMLIYKNGLLSFNQDNHE